MCRNNKARALSVLCFLLQNLWSSQAQEIFLHNYFDYYKMLHTFLLLLKERRGENFGSETVLKGRLTKRAVGCSFEDHCNNTDEAI